MEQAQPSRVAVITGAAQGIGRSIALRLAEDGLDVAVNDLASKLNELTEVVSQIQARGGRALAVPGDVSLEGDVEAMVATVVQCLGGLDVMVANAGILVSPLKPLVETSSESWDATISVNLRGAMLCYKHAAMEMIKQGRGGRIIGASSICGKQGMSCLSAYSASKFAIRGLTHSAAAELAQHNITVNTYSPGFIETTMTANPDMEKTLNLTADMPRAKPEVIASLVSYLVKPEAYFITGQTVMANGGSAMD